MNKQSIISAEMVAIAGVRFSQLQSDHGYLYWLEQRPAEAGRQVIMRLDHQGVIEEMTPPDMSVRSKANEYGGGDYLVKNHIIYFVNAKDQGIYQQKANEFPIKIQQRDNCRFADLTLSHSTLFLFAVRETHETNKTINDIVCIDLKNNDMTVIASGEDFFSNPVISFDDKKIAWLSWSLPQMPWDGTCLWQADFINGQTFNATHLSGSANESLYQPTWNKRGELLVVSDQTGWWNIYKVEQDTLTPLLTMDAEFGTSQWNFGSRLFAVVNDDLLLAIYSQNGEQHIGWVSPNTFTSIHTDCTSIHPYLAADKKSAYFIGSNAHTPAAIYRIDLTTSHIKMIKSTTDLHFESTHFSKPQKMKCQNEKGEWIHALLYLPALSTQSLPPLIVNAHSGPISAATTDFNLKIQYFTTRGFAYVDVNYRGSIGYGKHYRDQLKENWGVVDVADCICVTEYLIQQHLVDANRLFIRGSSAGGFTALCALTFYDVFSAGVVYYGISDLKQLIHHTPKFESKTLDTLIGDYATHSDRYVNRSPIHFANQIKAPVLLIHGLQDAIVPIDQSRMIIEKLKNNGIDCKAVFFENEGHGFRDAKNIASALREELLFYSA